MYGLHCGHVLLHISQSGSRLRQWLPQSLAMVVIGVVLHFTAVPMNTDLYSASFLLVTSGAGGVVLAMCYYAVDVLGEDDADPHWLVRPFWWMGQNAITM